MTRRTIATNVLAALTLTLLTAEPARAFQGPYTTIITGFGGYMIDLDVRWPDAGPPPPASGWPVLYFGHGAGGDKTTPAPNAEDFADDGYVTITWTNRDTATSPTPEVMAADLVAIKTWLIDDFENEASVTVPVDPAKFGITGASLGGYTSWSGALASNAFAVIVPTNWAFHVFREGIVRDGSIERVTGGPLASVFPDPYDSASLQAGFEAAFGPAFDAFPTVTIPVLSQLAMLDGRHGATYGLHDYLALTAASSRMVYLGTGGHGTPETDGSFRADLRRRWLDFHLKGEATGIDTELPIQIALLVTNEHLAYATWPPPDQQAATLYVRSGGTLSPTASGIVEPASTITNDPGSFTWDDGTPSFPPATIRANLPKSTIAFETAPLLEETLLLGEPSVTLHVAGTGSRYQVNVHLYDQPDGDDPILLAFGTATLDTSPAEIEVPLSLTGRRLPPGHRLRLEITNRDDQDLDYTDGFSPGVGFLRYIPFFELSSTGVYHDRLRPSRIELPLIGRDALPLPGSSCAPAPVTGCRLPAIPGRSSMTIKNSSDDQRDKLTWKWTKGAATTFGDLGDPTDTDDYVFCVYDGSGTPLQLQGRAPAGGLCGTKPCWKQLGSPNEPKGFVYVDRELTPDGVSKVQVKAGEVEKAKALVKGKGTTLDDPTLPLVLPVRAQLQTTSTCFEVTYATAQVNTPEQFKAK